MENCHNGSVLFGRPRWIWRAAVRAELLYTFHRLFRRPEVWIDDLKQASALWGRLFANARRDVA